MPLAAAVDVALGLGLGLGLVRMAHPLQDLGKARAGSLAELCVREMKRRGIPVGTTGYLALSRVRQDSQELLGLWQEAQLAKGAHALLANSILQQLGCLGAVEAMVELLATLLHRGPPPDASTAEVLAHAAFVENRASARDCLRALVQRHGATLPAHALDQFLSALVTAAVGTAGDGASHAREAYELALPVPGFQPSESLRVLLLRCATTPAALAGCLSWVLHPPPGEAPAPALRESALEALRRLFGSGDTPEAVLDAVLGRGPSREVAALALCLEAAPDRVWAVGVALWCVWHFVVSAYRSSL